MISNTVITWTISLTIVLIVWPSSMNADKNAASLSFNNNQENKPATVEPFAKVNTLQAKESEIYRKQAHLIASGFSKILWDYIQQNYHNNSNIDSLDNCLQSYHAIFRLIELGNESVPRMLSASGRIPSNFFDGTYVDFGSFEQCLQIDTMESPYKDNLKFGGQYCLASLEPNLIVNYEDESQSSKLDEEYTENHKVINLYPHMFDRQFNLSIMIGYCVPSTCSSEQIQDLITKALEPYSWSFVQNVSCQRDKSFSTRLDEAPKSQKISLALVCTLIITVLMATIADYSLPWLKSSPPKFLQCFSMRKSMRVLLRKPDSERMLLLDILRVATFIAQFIMHSSTWHTIIRAAYLTDRMNLSSQSMRYWLVQPFLNTWTVEGLVILGGTSSCMGLWGKTTEKSSIFMYIPLILKKIRNTLPPLITIICLEIALPLFGSGPIYESMTGYMSNMCSNTFIYSICHVANFLHPFSRCAVQTWTLSVEVQLFIMVCFVIYVYKKIPRLGLVINLIFLSFGTWSLFHIFYTNDIPPQVTIMPLKAEKIFLYFEKYYLTTQAHVWSYFFALLLTKLIWDKIDEKMSKETFKKYFNILLVVLITQMFSTGLWNVLELNISRFWMAVYILVYQYIGATFWAAIFITQGPEFRRVYTPKKIKALNGQKVDKNLNLIDSSLNTVEKHQRELNNHQNNNDTNLIPKIKIHKNKASLIVSRKLIEHILGVSLRILRGTYFIHVTFLTWYCAQRKDILSHGIFDLVTRTHGLTILCIVSGFVFYLFVGGPTESLLHYFDKKPRQKVHQS